MKAKVAWKLFGRLKLVLEDGRKIVLDANQAKSLNPALQWGDVGILVNDTKGRTKFIPESEEQYLTPKPPDDIIVPIEHK